MNRFLLACVFAFVALFTSGVHGQEKFNWTTAAPIVTVTLEPAEVRPGQTATLVVSVKLKPEHYMYPTVQPDVRAKASRTTIVFPTMGSDLIPTKITDASDFKNMVSEDETLATYLGGTTWRIPVVVSPSATPGAKTFAFETFRFPICFNKQCLIQKSFADKTATYTVAGEPVPVDPQYKTLVDEYLSRTPPKKDVPNPKDAPPPKKEDPDALPPGEKKAVARKIQLDRDYAADMKYVQSLIPPPEVKNTGLWVFLGTAFTFGLVTLLTPCVFPMIPITVSVFLKQSEKKGQSPLIVALIYSLTIIVVLSAAALTLLKTFSSLAVNPFMNVALGLLFFVLTLSLFGMFELTLPSSLANFVGSKEGKGGYLGVVFMAISFTIVSFTCVAPFLGGFSGMAASGNFSTFQLVLGALAFAGAFASPFFLLALFPSLLKKLPKSGDWLNTIKVMMGFLELAAALKFFRTAELRWSSPPVIFTYDFVLAIWIALLVAMGLYLLGLFRMKHDHAEHVHIGPLRLMIALVCFGIAVYLTPALFTIKGERQRPAGTLYAWVDAFLLPEPSASGAVEGELPWSGDLRGSLDEARAKNGVVFVDFTGVTCSNCRLNERNVFVKPEVQELFKQYTLVAIYTDTVPEYFYDQTPTVSRQNHDGKDINRVFMEAVLGSETLPTYLLLKPTLDGKVQVLGTYDEGKINNDKEFIEFLKKGLK